MRINRITLYNYRLYKGENIVSFKEVDGKNLYLIFGENGYGKTTFLHSLIWCLYGKFTPDVEASMKKDVNANGYSTYLKDGLNNDVKSKLIELDGNIIASVKKSGYSSDQEWVKMYSQYYVRIDFTDVIIPSLPCTSISIIRKYDYIQEKESIEVLIDGVKSELTDEIGPEIFINDFILNKDIARFFFFDSEQIVSLAEINGIGDRRKLCSAYNEVLGVRKYEDLRRNLENIRLRFRKKSSDANLRDVLLEKLEKQSITETEIQEIKSKISEVEASLEELHTEDSDLQQQLAREGNNITTIEINKLRDIITVTKKKDEELKAKLKEFLELAPFAISGKLFYDARQQVEKDHTIQIASGKRESNNELVNKIQVEFIKILKSKGLPSDVSMDLQLSVQEELSQYLISDECGEVLIGLDKEEYKEFISTYNYILSTYKVEFERLYEDFRRNKLILERNTRRLSNIQSKENDKLIESIRKKKNSVELKIETANRELRSLHEKLGITSQIRATLNKRISELTKKVSVDDIDEEKDRLAAQLISELNQFLTTLKNQKKHALECRIKETLNTLMHKEDFISRVEVVIEDDSMDINLYAVNNVPISKDSLSKGEQQLYASSILKALVEESGIEFPVFIDSPLQKFDKSHASKIITEFYPSISRQVVLFPLMHKELTDEEYQEMLPLIADTFVITNYVSSSSISKVDIDNCLNWHHNV